MHLSRTAFAATLILAPGLARAGGADAFDRAMAPVLRSYLNIHDILASDRTVGIEAAARELAAFAKKLDVKSVTGDHAEHYQHLPMRLQKAAAKLIAAKGIEATREGFKELSKPMATWGKIAKPEGVVVLICAAARGTWLQKKGYIRNPYYGAGMLGCGEIVGGDNSTSMYGGLQRGNWKYGEHPGEEAVSASDGFYR